MAFLRSHPAVTRLGLPVAVLVFYFLVPIRGGDAPIGEFLGAVAAVLSIGVVAWVIIEESRRARRRLRPLHLLLAFELALIGFSLVYYLIAVAYPGELNGLSTRLDALYFSLTTMATVGYGDINATGQLGRLVVSVQLAFNLFFVAALVSLVQEQVRVRRSMAGHEPGEPGLGGDPQ